MKCHEEPKKIRIFSEMYKRLKTVFRSRQADRITNRTPARAISPSELLGKLRRIAAVLVTEKTNDSLEAFAHTTLPSILDHRLI